MPPRRRKSQGSASSAPPKVQNFQFINLGKEARIVQDDDRSIIREAVMNDFHQKKRQKKNYRKDESTPKGSVTFKDPIAQQINVFSAQSQKDESSSGLSRRTRGSNQGLSLTSYSNTSTGEVTSASNLDIRTWSGQNNLKNSTRDTAAKKTEEEAAVQRLIESLDLVPEPLDPLINFPPNSEPRSRYLIHYFFSTRSHSSFLMMGVRKSWFQASLQDSAFFTVILAHYAATVTITTKAGDPVESLVLRMEASRIVNDRLEDEEDRISDGTIAAVASMLVYEANNGAVEAVKTHMNGLSRMIALRGGFVEANFPPTIQRQIAWADLQTSTILSIPSTIIPFTHPYLSLPAYNSTTTPHGPLASSSTCWNPSNLIDFSHLITSLETILADLCFLTCILDTQPPHSIEEPENMWYSDKMYVTQRSMTYLSLYPQPGDSKLDTACISAASIFTHVHLRDLGFYSKVVGDLTSVLKDKLDGILREGLEADEQEDGRLFWVLVVGGLCAFGKEERRWFVERLREVVKRLEVTGLRDAEERVRGILWTKKWTPRLETLWEEIVNG